MLRVRVCAAHMGWILGPKSSKKGPLYWQIFLRHGWVIQKFGRNWQFSPKIHHKSGFDSKLR